MRFLAGRGLWLLTVWVFLWEDLSFANVLSGAMVATAVLVVFPPRRVQRRGRFRPVAAVKFLAYFTWKLVQANLVVAWEIITPRNRINEAVVDVPIRYFSEALTTLLANAISLTPGTLTIEVNRDATVLYVHVLHLRSVEQVRQEVQTLELLAVNAFGSAEAIEESRKGGPGRPGEKGRTQEGKPV